MSRGTCEKEPTFIVLAMQGLASCCKTSALSFEGHLTLLLGCEAASLQERGGSELDSCQSKFGSTKSCSVKSASV